MVHEDRPRKYDPIIFAVALLISIAIILILLALRADAPVKNPESPPATTTISSEILDRSSPDRADRSTRDTLPPAYDYEGEQHAIAHITEIRQAARAQAEREAQDAAAAARAPAPSAPSEPPPVRPQRAGPPPAPQGDVWWALAGCESGHTNANTGNSYYGYFQFLPSTWRSVGGTGLPTDHSYAEQRHRAIILQQRSGWSQWPACTRRLGLR